MTFLVLAWRILGKLPANSGFQAPPPPPKFMPRIVGIPIQCHFLEPKYFAPRFSALRPAKTSKPLSQRITQHFEGHHFASHCPLLPDSWGGKTGSICHFALPLFCSTWGSQDTQMLGREHKISHSHTLFVCPEMLVRTKT